MIKDRGNKSEALKGTVVVPEGVSFDGSTDYLSRSSDFAGNVDSKTFTFSCWVYYDGTTEAPLYASGDIGLVIYIENGQLLILGRNALGGNILLFSISNTIPTNTWSNIIIDVDLSNNIADVYLNDSFLGSAGTKTDDFINMTNSVHLIGETHNNDAWIKGRLFGMFLSRERVDMSVEANRRIFINADGTPA